MPPSTLSTLAATAAGAVRRALAAAEAGLQPVVDALAPGPLVRARQGERGRR